MNDLSQPSCQPKTALKNEKATKKETSLDNITYIAFGANLSEPIKQIQSAVDNLNSSDKVSFIASSSYYSSKPMGPQNQNDYINSVVKFKTSLTALELLDLCQQIENLHGRVRKNERWGPRSLDLDIILYNNETIVHQRLTVPHYGVFERNFVLFPLQEIEPNLVFPGGQKIDEQIKKISHKGIIKL